MKNTPQLKLDNKDLEELKRLFADTRTRYEIAKSHFEYCEAEMLLEDLKVIKKQYKKLKQQVYIRDGEIDFFSRSISENDAAIVIY
ncbi:hypothetical protein AB3N04_01205 (plasmid) [Alkalihalophilus sp. As8PL]|uniref:Control of competence regulator ComK, YlbF/YmcA n=1 Tax=Alkalihalophilus sp. As8PL TaxID=3237103 RepID=A0AB39BMU9_9BACI